MDQFRAILTAASNGDDEAWVAIIDRYQQMMRLALNRAGMSPELRQRLDPEDVMQRALMRAHRELPTALPLDQEAFTTWLLRVTVHSLEDRVRHHFRERRSLQGEVRGSSNLVHADRREGPDSGAARVEARVRLTGAITKLDDQDQRLVLWRVVEEQSIQVIAEALGITEDKVRWRLTSALSRLRTALREE